VFPSFIAKRRGSKCSLKNCKKVFGTLLDDWQDKSVLIDLKLLTKDKEWFEEVDKGDGVT
jgi:hypothetical protein